MKKNRLPILPCPAATALLPLAICSLLLLPGIRAESEKVRTWTNTQGKKIQATLVDTDGTTVKLRLPNDNEAEVPLTGLSAEDQKYAAAWLEKIGGDWTISKVGFPKKVPKHTHTVYDDKFDGSAVATIEANDGSAVFSTGKGKQVVAMRATKTQDLYVVKTHIAKPKSADSVKFDKSKIKVIVDNGGQEEECGCVIYPTNNEKLEEVTEPGEYIVVFHIPAGTRPKYLKYADQPPEKL